MGQAMTIDVNVFLGAYPWRRVPGTSVEAILQAMDRVGTARAWVSHLPGLFWKDPMEGNPWLYRQAAGHDRLLPVPAIHPELPHWQEEMVLAGRQGVPAVRCDPMYQGLDPTGPAIRALAAECGALEIPLLMAVRLEDSRQRHPNDGVADLPPHAVRALIRSHPHLKLVITHADRGFIEEVHFGSTPEESARIWWDICWVWGPPEDHLETLLTTIGPERFLFGTGMPLRIPESSRARLDLLDVPPAIRDRITHGNVQEIRST
ncbi:MAG: amidohydrolase family protein [Gemmatimonadales bacterium]